MTQVANGLRVGRKWPSEPPPGGGCWLWSPDTCAGAPAAFDRVLTAFAPEMNTHTWRCWAPGPSHLCESQRCRASSLPQDGTRLACSVCPDVFERSFTPLSPRSSALGSWHSWSSGVLGTAVLASGQSQAPGVWQRLGRVLSGSVVWHWLHQSLWTWNFLPRPWEPCFVHLPRHFWVTPPFGEGPVLGLVCSTPRGSPPAPRRPYNLEARGCSHPAWVFTWPVSVAREVGRPTLQTRGWGLPSWGSSKAISLERLHAAGPLGHGLGPEERPWVPTGGVGKPLHPFLPLSCLPVLVRLFGGNMSNLKKTPRSYKQLSSVFTNSLVSVLLLLVSLSLG